MVNAFACFGGIELLRPDILAEATFQGFDFAYFQILVVLRGNACGMRMRPQTG
jgi:hypothetical protein